MRRLLTILVGLGLVGLGILALSGTWMIPAMEIRLGYLGAPNLGQLWPMAVIGLGLALALVFFIPALPILITGGILLVASLAHWWQIWRWAWPLEILSLAAAFLCAALYARNIWLVIPAIFLGLNGLALQFCALTGWWGAWAVLWPVEFLAVGLTLLIVGFHVRSGAVLMLALLFCGLSGAAVGGMLTLVTGQAHLAGLVGAGSLIFLGVVLLVWSLARPRRAAKAAASQAL
jgi:hypothetical protein